MEEWKKYKIGDIGKVITGKTPKTNVEKNYGGNIPFLTPSDDLSQKYAPKTAKTLTKLGLLEVKNCLLPPDSVCVSCIGSDLGKVVMLQRETVTNQQFNSIIPKKEYDPNFIYYIMNIIGRELNFLSKTSTAVPIINKSVFSNYTVHIPSLELQKQIADILSVLDDKIALNTRINDNLEQQAQALYKSWFVDFEPFKGGKFVDSELGEIPEGFSVIKVGDICSSIYDSSNLSKINLVFLNTGDISRGEFLHSNFSNVSEMPGQAKKAIKKPRLRRGFFYCRAKRGRRYHAVRPARIASEPTSLPPLSDLREISIFFLTPAYTDIRQVRKKLKFTQI